jgi:hypothetical protein
MSNRNWKLGDVSWGWPDDVDATGTDTACGYRYLPVIQTDCTGYSWEAARVRVDEDDDEMLADARLIASAPEMLAVMREAKSELIDLYAAAYPDDESDNDTTAVIDRMIAVINRATGAEDED